MRVVPASILLCRISLFSQEKCFFWGGASSPPRIYSLLAYFFGPVTSKTRHSFATLDWRLHIVQPKNTARAETVKRPLRLLSTTNVPFVRLTISSGNVHHFTIGRKTFSSSSQQAVSSLILRGKPRFA